MTSSTEAEGHKKSKLKGTKIIGSLTGGLPPCREGTIKPTSTIDTPMGAQHEIESIAVKLGKRGQKRK